ncbi:MAG: DUF1573 domain-containing protein [Phycisphaerae bacterium]
MNKTKTWFACALIVTFYISIAGAKQVLKATPEKVEFCTFNTFQVKEAIVTLKNTDKKTFLIDKIKADCTCVRTRVATKEIAADKSTELKIAAMQRTEGKFSHNVLVIPKDRENHKPVRIQATGKVIQPVSAKIGWLGKTPKAFDPEGPMRLGLVHHLSAKPVIYITAKDEHFNLRDSAIDVNSLRFELDDYKFENITPTGQKDTDDDRKEMLVLRLKPKKTLKTGILREFIIVKLAEDVRLFMPIICRIVGDVYSTEQMINMGTLSDSALKECSIYFTNDTRPWEDIKWTAKGYLSDAIVISRQQAKSTGSCIRLTLSVDQSKLARLPKGYLFCRIQFYRNKPTNEDKVSVLVDGFN